MPEVDRALSHKLPKIELHLIEGVGLNIKSENCLNNTSCILWKNYTCLRKASPKIFCDHNQTWYCNHIVPNGGQGILLQVCLRIEMFHCLGEEEKNRSLPDILLNPWTNL